MLKTLFLALISLNNPSEATMNQQTALTNIESCYNLLVPALEKNEQEFLWITPIPDPFFNAVTHLICDNTEEKVDQILSSVAPTAPLSFWIHPQNRSEGLKTILQQRGFNPCITCPLMQWTVKPTPAPDFDIRPVGSNMDAFMAMTSAAFHFTPEVAKAYEAFLNTKGPELYLAYMDNQPVGTGIICPCGQIGGIFNIATAPEYEKKGVGRSMMQFLMNRANELQLKELALLSSPTAENFYKQLEFQNVYDIEIYAR